MLKLKQYRDAAVGLPDLLNYALMPDEGIVQGKDGSLMASWYFRGEDMGSSTAQELAQLSARLNHALVQLGSGWMIHVDAIRQYARSYPPLCPFPDRTTLVIDAERRVQYEHEAAHLESVYAMTLTYLPPKAAETKIAGWIYSGKKNDTEGMAGRILNNYKNALMDFESAISGVLKGRRMRATEQTDGVIGHYAGGAAYTLDEQLRFFNYCITGEDRPVRLPSVPMYLDALIGNQPLLTGIEPQVGDKHIAVIALDGYPQESWPGMLGALDTLSITYRWNTRFIFLDGHEAKAIMNKHRKKWQQKQRGLKDQIFKTSTGAVDLDALQQTNDVESAMSEVESGVLKFGYHTANIIVMHDDPVGGCKNFCVNGHLAGNCRP
ncbi:MAG TPA: conjugal transfer protein TrbE, partial [Halothiobacillus sp.]|nr:conjugal transfer protein TrbE [Halothiobacillus sp.]